VNTPEGANRNGFVSRMVRFQALERTPRGTIIVPPKRTN